MSKNDVEINGGGSGCAIVGVLLAGYCSFAIGNPVGWVIIHALCGWLYLLYLCFGCGGGLPAGDLWDTPAKDVVEQHRGAPKK